MAANINENTLIDFISEEIFDNSSYYDFGSGTSNPIKYMSLDVMGIGDLVSIKIGKLNFPGTSGNSYWCIIKHKDRIPCNEPPFFTITGVANYVANYIGSNLIWVDI
jgi:hypothetical protein